LCHERPLAAALWQLDDDQSFCLGTVGAARPASPQSQASEMVGLKSVNTWEAQNRDQSRYSEQVEVCLGSRADESSPRLAPKDYSRSTPSNGPGSVVPRRMALCASGLLLAKCANVRIPKTIKFVPPLLGLGKQPSVESSQVASRVARVVLNAFK
jgi:hypothetical protein